VDSEPKVTYRLASQMVVAQALRADWEARPEGQSMVAFAAAQGIVPKTAVCRIREAGGTVVGRRYTHKPIEVTILPDEEIVSLTVLAKELDKKIRWIYSRVKDREFRGEYIRLSMPNTSAVWISPNC